MEDKEKLKILQDAMERIFDLPTTEGIGDRTKLYLMGMEAYQANTRTGRRTRGFHFEDGLFKRGE